MESSSLSIEDIMESYFLSFEDTLASSVLTFDAIAYFTSSLEFIRATICCGRFVVVVLHREYINDSLILRFFCDTKWSLSICVLHGSIRSMGKELFDTFRGTIPAYTVKRSITIFINNVDCASTIQQKLDGGKMTIITCH